MSLTPLSNLFTLESHGKSLAAMVSHTEKSEMIHGADILYWIERKLISNTSTNMPRTIYSCCSLAAIIIIENHFREIRFDAAIMDRVIGRLYAWMVNYMSAIQDKSNLSCATHRAIVWVSAVGAIANNLGKWQERRLFEDNLVQSCDALGLQTWYQVEEVLLGFLWPSEWVGFWGEALGSHQGDKVDR
jgi:hypothetical protein